ncbi:uncharacterized protein METZ01_LOCUS313622 [marine metagenome]|uniref:Uncharacterized protein n=1 Tax=marine metagenome TaxID=408172 RepID=A0A382NJU9_9ZZZZ
MKEKLLFLIEELNKRLNSKASYPVANSRFLFSSSILGNVTKEFNLKGISITIDPSKSFSKLV